MEHSQGCDERERLMESCDGKVGSSGGEPVLNVLKASILCARFESADAGTDLTYTRCAQVFKFSLYVTMPAVMTYIVVAQPEVLQNIIKNVSARPSQNVQCRSLQAQLQSEVSIGRLNDFKPCNGVQAILLFSAAILNLSQPWCCCRDHT